MSTERILPLGGRWVHEVSFASIGSYLKLAFWPFDGDGVPLAVPEYTLQIEGAFTLRLADQEFEISMVSSPHPACLHLVGKKVVRSSATDGGELRLSFEDGDQLTIPPAKYEPWNLVGDDGSDIVSLAGGGLA